MSRRRTSDKPPRPDLVAGLPRLPEQWLLVVLDYGKGDGGFATVRTRAGQTRAWQAFSEPFGPGDLLALVDRAAAEPAPPHHPGRPVLMRVSMLPTSVDLGSDLQARGIAWEHEPSLEVVLAVLEDVRAWIQRMPSDTTTGTPEETELDLCRAAAEVVQARPWRHLDPHTPLVLRTARGAPPVGVVAILPPVQGSSPFVMVHASEASWKRALERDDGHYFVAGSETALAVAFRKQSRRKRKVKEFVEAGLPLAGPYVPSFGTTDPLGRIGALNEPEQAQRLLDALAAVVEVAKLADRGLWHVDEPLVRLMALPNGRSLAVEARPDLGVPRPLPRMRVGDLPVDVRSVLLRGRPVADLAREPREHVLSFHGLEPPPKRRRAIPEMLPVLQIDSGPQRAQELADILSEIDGIGYAKAPDDTTGFLIGYAGDRAVGRIVAKRLPIWPELVADAEGCGDRLALVLTEWDHVEDKVWGLSDEISRWMVWKGELAWRRDPG